MLFKGNKNNPPKTVPMKKTEIYEFKKGEIVREENLSHSAWETIVKDADRFEYPFEANFGLIKSKENTSVTVITEIE